jgi:hypothetical protein
MNTSSMQKTACLKCPSMTYLRAHVKTVQCMAAMTRDAQLGKLLPRRLVGHEVSQNFRVHRFDRFCYLSFLLQPFEKVKMTSIAGVRRQGARLHCNFPLVRQQVCLVSLQNFIIESAGAAVSLHA